MSDRERPQITEAEFERCKAATMMHKAVVTVLLEGAIRALGERATMHDNSKLIEPELSGYAELVPKLQRTTFGSDEYHAVLKEMAPVIAHHNENNRHHPEHHALGVAGMNLIDVLEMAIDWYAASMRSSSSFEEGVEHNIKRFGLHPQLAAIIKATAPLLEKWAEEVAAVVT